MLEQTYVLGLIEVQLGLHFGSEVGLKSLYSCGTDQDRVIEKFEVDKDKKTECIVSMWVMNVKKEGHDYGEKVILRFMMSSDRHIPTRPSNTK